MPKPIKSKTGSYTLMVRFENIRRNMTIGKVDKRKANRFASNIDLMIEHRKQNLPGIPYEIEAWIESLSNRHRNQLGELGLLTDTYKDMSVGNLINLFLKEYDKRPPEEVSASTKKTFRSSMRSRVYPKLKKRLVSDLEPQGMPGRRNAKPQFSEEAQLALKNFNLWQRRHYGSSTWSKDNKRLKQVGRWAVDVGHVDYNPFTPLPAPGEVGDIVDVPPDVVLDVMGQCLDPDTRLVFALGRFAGLRTPKECRTIKPDHVDFQARTFKIFDCKEKEFRKMPLFDLVYDEFVLHRSQVDWGRYVMSNGFRHKSDANNWGLMKEAVKRSAHKAWPDLRRNLRSSCVNELLEAGFPEWKVCAWLGHSVRTSRKHYQEQTDKQLAAAVETMRSLV